jgi:hypothetical protein
MIVLVGAGVILVSIAVRRIFKSVDVVNMLGVSPFQTQNGYRRTPSLCNVIQISSKISAYFPFCYNPI